MGTTSHLVWETTTTTGLSLSLSLSHTHTQTHTLSLCLSFSLRMISLSPLRRRVCDQTGAHVACGQKYAIASRQTPTRRQVWPGSPCRWRRAHIYRSDHRSSLYARGNETPVVNRRSRTHFVHKYIVTEHDPLSIHRYMSVLPWNRQGAFETICHLCMLASLLSTLDQYARATVTQSDLP